MTVLEGLGTVSLFLSVVLVHVVVFVPLFQVVVFLTFYSLVWLFVEFGLFTERQSLREFASARMTGFREIKRNSPEISVLFFFFRTVND